MTVWIHQQEDPAPVTSLGVAAVGAIKMLPVGHHTST